MNTDLGEQEAFFSLNVILSMSFSIQMLFLVSKTVIYTLRSQSLTI